MEWNINSLLPTEVLRIIFELLEDINTYKEVQRVCKYWKRESESFWKKHCKKIGYLQYEDFWVSNGKNWKWLCNLRQRTFLASEYKTGWGCDTKIFEGAVDHRTEYYEGYWNNNVKDVIGVWHVKTDKYSYTFLGQWKDGTVHGKSKDFFCYEENEGYFEGDFVNNEKCGKGTIHWTAGKWKGDRFEGEWQNNEKSGHGIYTYAKAGDCYNGQWKKDKKHGFGKYVFASGGQYEGEFRNGLMCGTGRFVYRSGNVYEGEMDKDEKSGYGKFMYKDYGSTYEGNWLNNKCHGEGTYAWSNGDSFIGVWDSGKRKRGVLFLKGQSEGIQQVWPDDVQHPFREKEPARYP